VTGLIAFTTIGFFAGGSFNPRFETADDPERDLGDRRTGAEKDFLVGVHLEQRPLAEGAARLLDDAGAEHVHCFDASGTPLPPQAGHPRPADPPGWWWRRAGRG
jgi:hypothetical protein